MTAAKAPTVRIGFAITDLDVGGAENMLVELVRRLDRRRWSPAVCCLRPPGPLALRLEDRGIPVVALNMRTWRDAPAGFWRMRRWLRDRQPSLLQTFLYHANILGRLAGRCAGVPVIVNGIRVADRRYGSASWPVRLDRLTARMADLHICVSDRVGQFARDQIGIPPQNLGVIPNGVDLRRWDAVAKVEPERWRVPESVPVLLVVGRLDRQKGIDVLIESLVALNRQSPLADRLRVLILGAGAEEASLRSAIARHSLNEVVELRGWQPDVERWLATADGLVLPSRWEGMPNVVLEAMAARRPVIATAIEGTNELVQAGETGWLVESDNPSELANAIQEFLVDPDRRRRMGEAGRRAMEANFTIETMVERYESWYRSLLQNHGIRV